MDRFGMPVPIRVITCVSLGVRLGAELAAEGATSCWRVSRMR